MSTEIWTKIFTFLLNQLVVYKTDCLVLNEALTPVGHERLTVLD